MSGYIKIQPDTYHPAMLGQLRRFMLQLDFDEEQRATAAGEAPKFRLLPLDLMIAVDAMQSLNGVARPFAAWADLRNIRTRGVRYDIPDVPEVAQTPIPAARFLHVGDDWDDSAPDSGWTGLRDPMREALTEGSSCASEIVTTDDGRAILDLPTAQRFDVDPESAAFIADFEVDRLLSMHDAGNGPGSITAGYRWYVHYGCLTLSHSQMAEHDEIARRTAFKDRLGLTDSYDVRDVLARSVPVEDLSPQAREAWGVHGIHQAQLTLC